MSAGGRRRRIQTGRFIQAGRGATASASPTRPGQRAGRAAPGSRRDARRGGPVGPRGRAGHARRWPRRLRFSTAAPGAGPDTGRAGDQLCRVVPGPGRGRGWVTGGRGVCRSGVWSLWCCWRAAPRAPARQCRSPTHTHTHTHTTPPLPPSQNPAAVSPAVPPRRSPPSPSPPFPACLQSAGVCPPLPRCAPRSDRARAHEAAHTQHPSPDEPAPHQRARRLADAASEATQARVRMRMAWAWATAGPRRRSARDTLEPPVGSARRR